MLESRELSKPVELAESVVNGALRRQFDNGGRMAEKLKAFEEMKKRLVKDQKSSFYYAKAESLYNDIKRNGTSAEKIDQLNEFLDMVFVADIINRCEDGEWERNSRVICEAEERIRVTMSKPTITENEKWFYENRKRVLDNMRKTLTNMY